METVRLFIGGLPADVDQKWIESRFHAISVDLPGPKNSSEPRQFAYVQVSSDQAPSLIKKFHNCKFRGNKLRIEIAKPNFLDGILRPESHLPVSEQKQEEPTIVVEPILKIRHGRKRTREPLVHDRNPRHVKFNDSSDVISIRKSEVTTKPLKDDKFGSDLAAKSSMDALASTDFCWSATATTLVNDVARKTPELATSSFLLAGRQALNKSAGKERDVVEPSLECAILESVSSDELTDDSSRGDDMSDGAEVARPETSPAKEPDSIISPASDVVMEDIRQSNQAMLAVFNSMFGADQKTQQKLQWNHDRRYDPSDPESMRKWSIAMTNDSTPTAIATARNMSPVAAATSNTLTVSTPATNTPAPTMSESVLVSDKVELSSEWSSLWARSDFASSGISPETKFSLSGPNLEAEPAPEPAQPLNPDPIPNRIVVLQSLRSSFLDRCAQQYRQSGECFLFRRTASVAELIAACKEARHKRVHGYKRQIKDHRQAEQARHPRA